MGQNGRAVVFLHGFMGDLNSFRCIASQLFDCKILLVSMYGFGNTPHPNYPLCISDYADGVLALIKQYSLEDVILVGHSFGGRVAIKLASQCDRISYLVLSDSAGMKPKRGLGYYFKVLCYKTAKRLGIKTKAQGSEDYRQMKGAMRKTFVNIVNEFQEREAEKISQPTLLIWGERDEATPLYMAKRLNRLIKNSSLIIFRGCTHFAYLEDARRFAGIIKGLAGG